MSRMYYMESTDSKQRFEVRAENAIEALQKIREITLKKNVWSWKTTKPEGGYLVRVLETDEKLVVNWNEETQTARLL